MATPATPIPNPMTDKPPRPRRWIPLSLRMFAAILVLLGVGRALLIWVSYHATFYSDLEKLKAGQTNYLSLHSTTGTDSLLKQIRGIRH